MKILIAFCTLCLATLSLSGAEALSIKEVDTPPSPITQGQPKVPASLRNIKGTIQVSMIIDENGNVRDAAIVKTTADELNAVALECVSEWRFNPAQKSGANVPVMVVVPLRFK